MYIYICISVYIYIYTCVYTYVVCVCANVYSMRIHCIYICIPTVGDLLPLDVQNYRSKFKLLFFFGVSPKKCVSFNFCYFMFFPVLS